MLSNILKSAKKAYEDDLDRQLAQIAAEEREKNGRLDTERAEVRKWLCTIMPEALVEYIDLSEYSHYAAKHYPLTIDRDVKGTWLTMRLPDAFPIRLNVYRDGEAFELVNEPYTGGDLRFVVPEYAQVEHDEDGVPYINHSNWTRRNHADWQTAVGKALALWAEYGERLTAELNAPAAPEPAPEELGHLDIDKLMRSSWSLTQSMLLRDGPRDGHEQLMVAQVCANLAIANQLKRIADILAFTAPA